MLEVHLPNLTFPDVTFGEEETPWDLRRWIYKGGAGANARTVVAMIDEGKLGRPLVERVELVHQIHEVLSNYLGRGGRRSSVASQIWNLAQFFRWADDSSEELSLPSIEQSYHSWTESLLQRVLVSDVLSKKTAYSYGSTVGWVLDRILDRTKPIAATNCLRIPKKRARAVSPQSDKQNLEETFAFGHLLLDISDALSSDAIWGPLPVRIPLRNGQELEEWSGFHRPETLRPLNPNWPYEEERRTKRLARNRANWEADKCIRTRYPLINLRIQVEMFMLMGQPAVNLAQAHQLRMDQWRYKASTQGYEVRTYKYRRWGPVEFEIYSLYRQVFERYLKWRTTIFPDDPDGLLFPLVGKGGAQTTRHPERAPYFDKLKDCCGRAGIKYLPPSALRSTNVNWMLRRTQDPDLTASEKQHATKTLLGVYEKPSQQRAMVQIKGYWAKHDPAQAAAGPGACLGKAPEPITDMPAKATPPDCETPAGCLFCAHQRDIDSLDHVWSLVSYRLLKSFELAAQARPDSKKALPPHPAEVVIERLTAKLNFVEKSSAQRGEWVKEALLRIEEGRYHPAWAGLIESV